MSHVLFSLTRFKEICSVSHEDRFTTYSLHSNDFSACYESDVLILPSCKTDSEGVSTRLLYLYLEYLRFLETSDILILVHYIVWHSLFVLETGLFKFVNLDDKALQSIALLFWLPTLNRSLQAFCLALLTLTTGNDLFISLVIHLSDVHPPCSSVFTSDFGQVNSYFLF